jgi:hypothetical protein
MLGNRGTAGPANDVTDKKDSQLTAPEIEQFLFR